MKGKAFKQGNRWFVSSTEVYINQPNTIYIHPDSDTSNLVEGQEVEFSIHEKCKLSKSDDGEIIGLVVVETHAILTNHSVETNELIAQFSGVGNMVENDVKVIGKPLEDYVREKHNQDRCMGFIDGWNSCKETLYTEEQVREAIDMARNKSGYVTYEYIENEIIQSLKQPKKD